MTDKILTDEEVKDVLRPFLFMVVATMGTATTRRKPLQLLKNLDSLELVRFEIFDEEIIETSDTIYANCVFFSPQFVGRGLILYDCTLHYVGGIETAKEMFSMNCLFHVDNPKPYTDPWDQDND